MMGREITAKSYKIEEDNTANIPGYIVSALEYKDNEGYDYDELYINVEDSGGSVITAEPVYDDEPGHRIGINGKANLKAIRDLHKAGDAENLFKKLAELAVP